jgi:hypothetical protein
MPGEGGLEELPVVAPLRLTPVALPLLLSSPTPGVILPPPPMLAPMPMLERSGAGEERSEYSSEARCESGVGSAGKTLGERGGCTATEKTEAAPGEGGRYFEVRGSSSGGTPAARWESVSGGTRKRSAATKRHKQAHTGLAAPELRSTSSARRQRWRLVVP